MVLKSLFSQSSVVSLIVVFREIVLTSEIKLGVVFTSTIGKSILCVDKNIEEFLLKKTIEFSIYHADNLRFQNVPASPGRQA